MTGSLMDAAAVGERLFALGAMVAGGRAGFLARYLAGSVVFVAVALVLRRLAPAARAWGLLAASVVLLAALTTVAIATVIALYTLVFFWVVERLPAGAGRTGAVVLLLALQVIGPITWLPLLPGYEGRVREYCAFATNLTLLRFWGYAYDRLVRPEPEAPTLRDYGLFMLFFPAFVNGPIVSHTDFQRRRLPAYWGDARAGALARLREEPRALGRIGLGIGLALVAMYWVCVPGTAHYEAAVQGGTLAAWTHAARVYLCVYLSFSAWTELAIGFGRLAGVVLPENFDAPFLAYGPADFWRRWNITLVHWLRRYIYQPLGGAFLPSRSGERRLEWRNTAAVFAFVAVYHLFGGLKLLGAGYFPLHSYLPWTLWALLNAVAVLATRSLARPARLGAGGLIVVALTFAFASLGIMTALYPPAMDLAGLGAIYRHLFPL